MRASYSYRIPKLTVMQIKALAEFAGCSDANIITLAIDRMMRDFTRPPTRDLSETDPHNPQLPTLTIPLDLL